MDIANDEPRTHRVGSPGGAHPPRDGVWPARGGPEHRTVHRDSTHLCAHPLCHARRHPTCLRVPSPPSPRPNPRPLNETLAESPRFPCCAAPSRGSCVPCCVGPPSRFLACARCLHAASNHDCIGLFSDFFLTFPDLACFTFPGLFRTFPDPGVRQTHADAVYPTRGRDNPAPAPALALQMTESTPVSLRGQECYRLHIPLYPVPPQSPRCPPYCPSPSLAVTRPLHGNQHRARAGRNPPTLRPRSACPRKNCLRWGFRQPLRRATPNPCHLATVGPTLLLPTPISLILTPPGVLASDPMWRSPVPIPTPGTTAHAGIPTPSTKALGAAWNVWPTHETYDPPNERMWQK